MATPVPPPPPPPPPPPNPWANRPISRSKALIAGSTWPHRLLYVRSMTSYVREGQNVYNGVEAPSYNILSYTWGYYRDPNPTSDPLLVHGINWPIPPIKEDHFSALTLKHAIENCAMGYKHRCDWVWIDIACIPQEHEHENFEAATLRGQEIGNQVEIFGRAQEAFAWLSSINLTSLLETAGPMIDIVDLIDQMNQGVTGFPTAISARDYILRVEKGLRSLEIWMNTILGHPWLQSLWTLQEMVLRPDAFILFNDGLLSPYGSGKPWTFNTIKTDLFTLRDMFSDSRRMELLRKAEAMMMSLPEDQRSGAQHHVQLATNLKERCQLLVATHERKGLDALHATFPHTAYSLAQYRRVTKPQDRIHGIVQLYGITCNPFPVGRDSRTKLHALEDEFGKKLLEKCPVLAQCFIHSSVDEKPRRSWLITQRCKVDDYFWTHFSSGYQVENNFQILETIPWIGNTDDIQDIIMHFKGRAWYLDEFARHSREQLPPGSSVVFQPCSRGSSHLYRGLMLDNHISETILGEVIDYFVSHEQQLQAVTKLHQHYSWRKVSELCLEEPREADQKMALRIALIGSGFVSNFPMVYFVGLVLAPVAYSTNSANGSGRTLRSQSSNSSNMLYTASNQGMIVWERIGLMRWAEHYLTKDTAHPGLPPYHEFECVIA